MSGEGDFGARLADIVQRVSRDRASSAERLAGVAPDLLSLDPGSAPEVYREAFRELQASLSVGKRLSERKSSSAILLLADIDERLKFRA